MKLTAHRRFLFVAQGEEGEEGELPPLSPPCPPSPPCPWYVPRPLHHTSSGGGRLVPQRADGIGVIEGWWDIRFCD